MNRKHLQEEAKTLYVKGFYNFKDIEKKLHISERTLRTWAKKDNWGKSKKDYIKKTEGILKDQIEIAQMLGTVIKEELKKGNEPSASMLNAYRGITANLSKVKQFEEDNADNKEPTTDLSDLTKNAIKNTFA